MTYQWSLTRPGDSVVTLSDSNSSAASFTPDVEVVYAAWLLVSDPLGPGVPDSVSVTATNPEQYAQVKVIETAAVVAQLTPEDVTSAGNQEALTAFLAQSANASTEGNTDQQIAALERAIERTDGCVLRNGVPDGKGPGMDWITDSAAQVAAYAPLKDALDALQPPTSPRV